MPTNWSAKADRPFGQSNAPDYLLFCLSKRYTVHIVHRIAKVKHYAAKVKHYAARVKHYVARVNNNGN